MQIRSIVPLLATAAVGALLFTACDGGDKSTETDSSETESTETQATDTEDGAAEEAADELLGLMDGYADWDQVADWEGIVASEDGTHGDYVQVWYNSTAYDTVQAGAGGDMPDGAILVKQGYADSSGTENNLTVMWKTDSYSTSTGWFWANWSSEGELNAAGDVSGCTSCHSAGQDYVTTATW